MQTRLTRTYAGEAPSIALDASGKVYVAVARAYWAANPGVYLITNRTGAWVTSLVVDSFGTTGTSVVVKPGGLARIAYDNEDWGVSVLDETSLAPQTVRSRAALMAIRGLARFQTAGQTDGGPSTVAPPSDPRGPAAPRVSSGAALNH